ncbi:hypothetical protein M0811_03774 [Anaeramoeba ignava]|uniref:Uncharacterized protein n=1 Tax=Anaeramoeba ignava TaxID=1746090 RepID=A0A9Q0RHL8_ANAIG|nr:hypothetical protein M0811_03774 [Anaeramoeba ignava]
MAEWSKAIVSGTVPFRTWVRIPLLFSLYEFHFFTKETLPFFILNLPERNFLFSTLQEIFILLIDIYITNLPINSLTSLTGLKIIFQDDSYKFEDVDSFLSNKDYRNLRKSYSLRNKQIPDLKIMNLSFSKKNIYSSTIHEFAQEKFNGKRKNKRFSWLETRNSKHFLLKVFNIQYFGEYYGFSQFLKLLQQYFAKFQLKKIQFALSFLDLEKFVTIFQEIAKHYPKDQPQTLLIQKYNEIFNYYIQIINPDSILFALYNLNEIIKILSTCSNQPKNDSKNINNNFLTSMFRKNFTKLFHLLEKTDTFLHEEISKYLLKILPILIDHSKILTILENLWKYFFRIFRNPDQKRTKKGLKHCLYFIANHGGKNVVEMFINLFHQTEKQNIYSPPESLQKIWIKITLQILRNENSTLILSEYKKKLLDYESFTGDFQDLPLFGLSLIWDPIHFQFKINSNLPSINLFHSAILHDKSNFFYHFFMFKCLKNIESKQFPVSSLKLLNEMILLKSHYSEKKSMVAQPLKLNKKYQLYSHLLQNFEDFSTDDQISEIEIHKNLSEWIQIINHLLLKFDVNFQFIQELWKIIMNFKGKNQEELIKWIQSLVGYEKNTQDDYESYHKTPLEYYSKQNIPNTIFTSKKFLAFFLTDILNLVDEKMITNQFFKLFKKVFLLVNQNENKMISSNQFHILQYSDPIIDSIIKISTNQLIGLAKIQAIIEKTENEEISQNAILFYSQISAKMNSQDKVSILQDILLKLPHKGNIVSEYFSNFHFVKRNIQLLSQIIIESDKIESQNFPYEELKAHEKRISKFRPIKILVKKPHEFSFLALDHLTISTIAQIIAFESRRKLNSFEIYQKDPIPSNQNLNRIDSLANEEDGLVTFFILDQANNSDSIKNSNNINNSNNIKNSNNISNLNNIKNLDDIKNLNDSKQNQQKSFSFQKFCAVGPQMCRMKEDSFEMKRFTARYLSFPKNFEIFFNLLDYPEVAEEVFLLIQQLPSFYSIFKKIDYSTDVPLFNPNRFYQNENENENKNQINSETQGDALKDSFTIPVLNDFFKKKSNIYQLIYIIQAINICSFQYKKDGNIFENNHLRINSISYNPNVIEKINAYIFHNESWITNNFNNEKNNSNKMIQFMKLFSHYSQNITQTKIQIYQLEKMIYFFDLILRQLIFVLNPFLIFQEIFKTISTSQTKFFFDLNEIHPFIQSLMELIIKLLDFYPEMHNSKNRTFNSFYESIKKMFLFFFSHNDKLDYWQDMFLNISQDFKADERSESNDFTKKYSKNPEYKPTNIILNAILTIGSEKIAEILLSILLYFEYFFYKHEFQKTLFIQLSDFMQKIENGDQKISTERYYKIFFQLFTLQPSSLSKELIQQKKKYSDHFIGIPFLNRLAKNQVFNENISFNILFLKIVFILLRFEKSISLNNLHSIINFETFQLLIQIMIQNHNLNLSFSNQIKIVSLEIILSRQEFQNQFLDRISETFDPKFIISKQQNEKQNEIQIQNENQNENENQNQNENENENENQNENQNQNQNQKSK